MRPEDPDRPEIDDWLAEEDEADAPTRETTPRRRPPLPPGPDIQGRRVVALVAVVAVIVLIVVIATRGGDDEATPEGPAPAVTGGADTSPAQETQSQAPLVLESNGALAQGDSGRPVRRLQRALALLGYDVEPDGQFGPGTAEELRSFQADAGLDADGVAGADTIAALNAALRDVG